MCNINKANSLDHILGIVIPISHFSCLKNFLFTAIVGFCTFGISFLGDDRSNSVLFRRRFPVIKITIFRVIYFGPRSPEALMFLLKKICGFPNLLHFLTLENKPEVITLNIH